MCDKKALRELGKHIIGGFIFHGLVIFAASGLIGLASFFLPVTVEILNSYKDLFILSGVSGMFAGILGAMRAVETSEFSSKKMSMVPKFIREVLNRQWSFKSNGTYYTLSESLDLRIYRAENWRQYFLV